MVNQIRRQNQREHMTMGMVLSFPTMRSRAVLTLPDGRDPTAVTPQEVAGMIDEAMSLAERLRKRGDADSITAAAWLTFMAAVFTTKL
jgi:hypothetical protein